MKNIVSLFSSWLIWPINLWSFISPCFRLWWSFLCSWSFPGLSRVLLLPSEWCEEMFSSLHPSHLSSLDDFPEGKEQTMTTQFCRRWPNSHRRWGALNWRVQVALSSFLCNLQSITRNYPPQDLNSSAFKREKKDLRWRTELPMEVNICIPSRKSQGRKFLVFCLEFLELCLEFLELWLEFLELCLQPGGCSPLCDEKCAGDLTCQIITSIFAIFCWCSITQSFCFCFPFKKYYFPSIP